MYAGVYSQADSVYKFLRGDTDASSGVIEAMLREAGLTIRKK